MQLIWGSHTYVVILLCRMNVHNYQLVLAILFAISEINLNSHILPNTSLGLEIYNVPYLQRNVLRSVFYWLTGLSKFIPNYSCRKNSKSAAALTGILWKTSENIGTVLDLYKFPQVSSSDVSDWHPFLLSQMLTFFKIIWRDFNYLI